MVKLQVRKLYPDVKLPIYSSEEAAGADIHAYLGEEENVTIGMPFFTNGLLLYRALIPTGLSLNIPKGYEVQIRPRSGIALKHGITVLNSPATIDSDYTGEIKVLLINLGTEPFTIKNGDRIAQIVLAPVSRAEFEEVEGIEKETGRGNDGFGSTGV